MPPQPLRAPRSPHATATRAAAHLRVDVAEGREAVREVKVVAKEAPAKVKAVIKEVKVARMHVVKIRAAHVRLALNAPRSLHALSKAPIKVARVSGSV